MLIERKIFGLGGAILAGLLACANPAQAIIVVDSSGQVTGGRVYYAKETVVNTVTVGSEDWHVAATPASGAGSGLLQLRHPLGRDLNDGDSATITYTLTNMQFHGANAVLTVEEEGSNAAVTATLSSGGAAGDTTATFTLAGTSTATFARTRTLLLALRGIAVNPAAVGDIQVQVEKNAITNPDWILSGVVRVRKAGVLRESASPVSASAAFGTGFRSFAEGDSVRSDGLAASVGSLTFSVSEPGPHRSASAATPVTLLSQLFASGAITFTGDFSFTSGVFLSTDEDCSSTGDDRASVTVSGDDRTASVDDANGKHLCIEVSGTTQIPKVASYTASVAYTALASAAVPPGPANLALGGIGMGGSVVNIPYVTLNAPPLRENGIYAHRLQVFNRSNEAAAYRIDFLPPQGVTVAPLMDEGSFPPGNTAIRLANVVTSLSRGSRIALTLAVDAPPELLQVQTILVNTADGSTDTVAYTPE